MHRLFLLVMALVWGGAAMAADKPAFGPTPVWVQALELPTPDETIGGPAQMLLQDVQVRLRPEGTEHYSRTAFRVNTPQGLGALGSIGFVWSPEIDVVTFHHVRAVRGAEVIDLMGDGSGFQVLRREENLEWAMLDGRLTAVIQPVGLEVGDIIDFAYTLHRRDPITRGLGEVATGNLLAAPAGRSHIRVLWNKAQPTRYRLAEGMPKVKATTRGDQSELVVDLQDAPAYKIPVGAPGRFEEVGYVEVSQFASWREISTLMAPHYEEAALLAADSPVKVEAAKIRALSSDPKVQMAAALRLVQDRVRYVYLGMDNGHFLPASADQTWQRRFGDCKGKTMLLVALLRELGIKAEAALANTTRNDGLDQRLPQLAAFNHVFVRAESGGKVYWLDGARTGDRRLDEIAIDYRWALPLRAAGAELEQVPLPPAATRPQIATILHIDASGGLDIPAKATGEMLMSGSDATVFRTTYDNLPGAEREEFLKAYWAFGDDFLKVKKASATFDDAAGTAKITMEGEAKLNWTGSSGAERWHRVRGGEVGWNADFKREDGPHIDAPYLVDHPYFVQVNQTIVLPRGGVGFTLKAEDLDRKLGAWEIKRTASLNEGVVTVQSLTRSTAHEMSREDALAIVAPLAEILKNNVLLRAPSTFKPTDAEVAALASANPTAPRDVLERGVVYLNAGRYKEAIAELTKAELLDPKSAWPVANRAIARFWDEDLKGAEADADKALAIDPTHYIALNTKGLIAQSRGEYDSAVEYFTRSQSSLPNGVDSLRWRASVYEDLGKFDMALTELAAIERQHGLEPWTLGIKSRSLQALRKYDEALAAAEEGLRIDPQDASGLLQRANLHLLKRNLDEARKAYDATLAVEQLAPAYVGRSQTYKPEELALALRDLDEAIRLEPDLTNAWRVKTRLLSRAGRAEEALAFVDTLLSKQPKDQTALHLRADLLEDLKRYPEALEATSALVAAFPEDAGAYNMRCWVRATANLELDQALTDCNKAVNLAPDSAGILDSRGMVRLRRGEFDAAIADYDAALKLYGSQPESLYGRGLAKLRKGMNSEGQADLAAARKLDPKIDEEFAGYGLTP